MASLSGNPTNRDLRSECRVGFWVQPRGIHGNYDLDLVSGRLAHHSQGSQTLCALDSIGARVNSGFSWQGRYASYVVLVAPSMGNFGNPRTSRTLFLVVRDVALLGPNRSDRGLGKAEVVHRFTSWLLVGKLSLLHACISSANIWQRNHISSTTVES